MELQLKTFPKPTMAASIPPAKASDPPTSSRQDELEFREELRDWKSTTKRLEESLHKSFAIAYGQTTDAMREKLSENQNWNTINSNSDCISLLSLLRDIAHNTEEQTNPNLGLIQATQRLYRLTQKDNQTLEDYKFKFDNMLGVINKMEGCISQPKHLVYVSKRDYNTDY